LSLKYPSVKRIPTLMFQKMKVIIQRRKRI